jgi:hypothetical protein
MCAAYIGSVDCYFIWLLNPLGAFAFLAFGFAFAYGEGSPFIGWTHFALADLPYTKFGHVIIQVCLFYILAQATK